MDGVSIFKFFLFLFFGALIIVGLKRVIGNSPIYSLRAKKLQRYAKEIGCNYTADANTFKERVFKHERKYNFIKGMCNGKQLEIYDYSRPYKYTGLYYQPYWYLTFINNQSHKRLSVKQIKSIVDGSAS